MPFLNIMRKDLRILFRDRSAIIFLFAMPVMFILTFGMIFNGRDSQSGKSTPFHIAVANQDRGAQGGNLIAAMRQVGLDIEESRGGAEIVEEQVKSGNRPLGVVIPPDFSAQLEQAVRSESEAGKQREAAPVQARLRVLIDPAQQNVAGIAQGAIRGAAQRTAAPLYRDAMLQRVPPEYRDFATQMIGGPNQNGSAGQARSAVTLDIAQIGGASGGVELRANATAGDIMVPDYAVLFAFFLANSVAVSLLTERQEGTLRRMRCAPIAPSQILFGKLLARGAIGVMQVLMLFAIGKLWLHLNTGSSLIGLALTALATIFAATGLGLLIASFGKTTEQIAGVTTLALFLMGAVSGCMVPRMLLPEAMQRVSLVTPHAWALNAYQDLLLRHLPLSFALPKIGAVFLFGLAFYGLALARFRCE